MKFDIRGFFRKSVEKIYVSLKSDKNKGYFAWRLLTSMTISRWIFVRIRNALDKICRQNQITFYIQKRFSENSAFCEIMSKNIAEPAKSRMKIQYGACALHQRYTRACTWTFPREAVLTPPPPPPPPPHRNMYYFLLFHGNNGFGNALQYCVTRILFLVLFPANIVPPVLDNLSFIHLPPTLHKIRN